MKVAVVIPARDEEEHVGSVVGGAKEQAEFVLVVDDGSTDRTAEEAKEAGARVLKLSRNKGKGYAMRVGALRALDGGADAVVFMDADGQHRPEDIPRFVEKLEAGADIVHGARQGGEMPLVKKVGNFGIRTLFQLFFGGIPGDMLCGFKALTREALEAAWWDRDGYFVETEIMARASMAGLERETVEIPMIYHDPAKGTGVWDGLMIGWNMTRFKLELLLGRVRR